MSEERELGTEKEAFDIEKIFENNVIVLRLRQAGIYKIGDITKMTKKEVLQIPCIDQRAFDYIVRRLEFNEFGLKTDETVVDNI